MFQKMLVALRVVLSFIVSLVTDFFLIFPFITLGIQHYLLSLLERRDPSFGI
jgi:hypothetical protein